MNDQRIRLQSYFGFTKMPFTKYMWATKMFQAKAQQQLLEGLHLWLETRGIALIYGPPGTGKSITLRRFKAELDERRFDLFYLFNLRTTPTGFLRSLCRLLALPIFYRQADLFDTISAALAQYEERTQKHPIIIFDDAQGLSDQLLELLRLLANFAMDSEDRASFILAGHQKIALQIKQPQNEPFRQRITFSQHLTPFTIDQTQKYIHFHLKRAQGPEGLFTDNAVQSIFHMAKGLPRVINQVALQALIQAAIRRIDKIDHIFLKQHVLTNCLFDNKLDDDS